MALVTRCSNTACLTLFRVTPAQLQAFGGQVRCGNCGSVFDAFPTLTTVADAALRSAAGPAAAEREAQAPVDPSAPAVQAHPQAPPRSQPQPQPQPEPESESESAIEMWPESEPDRQPVIELQPEVASAPAMEPEPARIPEPAPVAASGAEMGPELLSHPASESESAPARDSAPVVRAELAPAGPAFQSAGERPAQTPRSDPASLDFVILQAQDDDPELADAPFRDSLARLPAPPVFPPVASFVSSTRAAAGAAPTPEPGLDIARQRLPGSFAPPCPEGDVRADAAPAAAGAASAAPAALTPLPAAAQPEAVSEPELEPRGAMAGPATAGLPSAPRPGAGRDARIELQARSALDPVIESAGEPPAAPPVEPPAERPFAPELTDYSVTRGPPARPLRGGEAAHSRGRRRGWLALGALLGVAGLGGLGWWLHDRVPPPFARWFESASTLVPPTPTDLLRDWGPTLAVALLLVLFLLLRKYRATWLVTLGALTLLLSAQLLYLYRSSIAAHYPATRPALEWLCTIARCEVGLPRLADQLLIEASDLQALDVARPSLIQLSATVRNRAAVTVAYPAIEVTLTDPQDKPLARRVLLPEQYLARGVDARAGLRAGGEFSIRLTLDTTELRPVGYRLYLFYP